MPFPSIIMIFSLKASYPRLEDVQSFTSELLQTAPGLFGRLLPFGVRLGVELVGIADDLFLDGLGPEVLARQGQVLMLYLACSKACACVPLCQEKWRALKISQRSWNDLFQR